MACGSFCRAFLFVLPPSQALHTPHPQLQNRSRNCSTLHSQSLPCCGNWSFCSQHELFAHNQILCCFSCIPIQKHISAAVIHLETRFFRNPFIIQTCANIQMQTSVLKVFWKCQGAGCRQKSWKRTFQTYSCASAEHTPCLPYLMCETERLEELIVLLLCCHHGKALSIFKIKLIPEQ